MASGFFKRFETQSPVPQGDNPEADALTLVENSLRPTLQRLQQEGDLNNVVYRLEFSESVPKELDQDDVLKQNRCPISGRAIRFAVRLRGNDTVYEKKMVEDWLQHNPNRLVPGDNERRRANDVEECRDIQNFVIEPRIRTICQEINNILQRAIRGGQQIPEA